MVEVANSFLRLSSRLKEMDVGNGMSPHRRVQHGLAGVGKSRAALTSRLGSADYSI